MASRIYGRHMWIVPKLAIMIAPELSMGLNGLFWPSKQISLKLRPLGSWPTYLCTTSAPSSFMAMA